MTPEAPTTPDISGAFIAGADLRTIRLRRGESQQAFWGRLGVRQAAGYSYENGAQMPRPVQILAWLTYAIGIPIDAAPDVLRAAASLATLPPAAIADIEKARFLAQHADAALAEALAAAARVQGGKAELAGART